jgi:membrane protease YdiL (CAAX protease family)
MMRTLRDVEPGGSARFRQAKAFCVLLVRQWLRSGMAGARIEAFRKGSAFVVRLAAVLAYASLGRLLGETSLRNAAAGVASVEWLLAGLLGFGMCWGTLTRARGLRGMSLPLGSALIDMLPANDGVRTAVELLEVGLAHVVIAAAFTSAAPALSTGVAVALGLVTSVAAVTLGAALMRWTFVLASPERSGSIAQMTTAGQGIFVALGFLGQSSSWSVHPSFLYPLARPLAGEGGLAAAFAFAGIVLGIACLALMAAERVGYDRSDVVPQRRFARVSQGQLSARHVDELLSRREPGGRRWPFILFSVVALAGLAVLLISKNGVIPDELASSMPIFLVGWTTWMAVSMASGVAMRAVARDLVARPMLAALPIEPRQLLDGKIAVVRGRLALGLSPLAFVLLAPLPAGVWLNFAWRTVAVCVAAWMYGSAAVSVAFLTGGAQSARPQPGGTVRLESLLLLSPIAALLFASSPWLTLVPLASLALVTFEAKRAATRVVRWLDDGEDFERETPEWRAALAFAAFQGSQLLAGRVVSAWTTDAGVVMGASYAISAVVLTGLVAYGRRDLAPLRFWPVHPVAIAVGIIGGTGTATFARFVARRLLDSGAAQVPQFSHLGQFAFTLATGALAPVVEEIFFRGWLQHAIARDLADGRRWLAPLIAALAFASVHPPASFLAVFPLGLVAGLLYARTSSLLPGIVAHATHNWVVVLFS